MFCFFFVFFISFLLKGKSFPELACCILVTFKPCILTVVNQYVMFSLSSLQYPRLNNIRKEDSSMSFY